MTGLDPPWHRTLDELDVDRLHLVLTSLEADHVGQGAALVEHHGDRLETVFLADRYRAGWPPSVTRAGPGHRLISALADADVDVRRCLHAGQQARFGDAVVRVHNPPERAWSRDPDAGSVVLEAVHPKTNRNAVIAGDVYGDYAVEAVEAAAAGAHFDCPPEVALLADPGVFFGAPSELAELVDTEPLPTDVDLSDTDGAFTVDGSRPIGFTETDVLLYPKHGTKNGASSPDPIAPDELLSGWPSVVGISAHPESATDHPHDAALDRIDRVSGVETLWTGAHGPFTVLLSPDGVETRVANDRVGRTPERVRDWVDEQQRTGRPDDVSDPRAPGGARGPRG